MSIFYVYFSSFLENSISRRSMDRLSWPESNTICIFNRHQIHGLMYKKTNCVSYYSTTQSNDSTKVDSTSEPPKKLSIIQKMKQLYKDYWRILVPVHIVTSIGWVGIFWIAAKKYDSIFIQLFFKQYLISTFLTSSFKPIREN